MGLLLLLVALIPTPQPSDNALSNFSRLSTALGQEIALVERNGAVRQGRLMASTADAATMEFASGAQVFSRGEIASVSRLKDGTRDGLIKGLLFGALLSLYITGELGGDATGACSCGRRRPTVRLAGHWTRQRRTRSRSIERRSRSRMRRSNYRCGSEKGLRA